MKAREKRPNIVVKMEKYVRYVAMGTPKYLNKPWEYFGPIGHEITGDNSEPDDSRKMLRK